MSRSAKDTPVTRGNYTDSEESLHQAKERILRSTGEAADSLDPLDNGEQSDIEIFSDVPYDERKMAMLQFMEEKVGIIVHDSTDKLAQPIPEVWNGGRVQRFIRGQEQFVKRKFVEVMARARRTVYVQERYRDADGNDAIRHVPHTSSMYPFSVTQDTPDGRLWLEKIRQEA